MLRTFTLLTALLLASASAVADDYKAASPGPGWEEANVEDDFIIFTKDDERSRQIIAVTDIASPASKVYQVVGDFVNYPKFMPYVKSARVDEDKGLELVVYTHLSPPLVDDRDYYIKVKKSVGDDKAGKPFKSAWTSLPTYGPEIEDIVRVQLNTGAWIIKPMDGGKSCRLTYELHTHPGGSIPNWIANKSNTIAIPDLFAAVRKRAAEK